MEKRRKNKDSNSVFKIGTVSLVFLIIAYQVALFVHRAATLRIEANYDRPDTVYIVQHYPIDSPTAGSSNSTRYSADFDNRKGKSYYCNQKDNSNSDDSKEDSSYDNQKEDSSYDNQKVNTSSSNQVNTSSSNHRVNASNSSADNWSFSNSLRESQENAEQTNSLSHSGFTQALNSNPIKNDTIRINGTHSQIAKQIRNSKRKVESFRFNPNTASVDELMRLGFSEKQAQSIDNYRQKGGKFRRKSDFAKSFVVSDSIYRRLEKYIDIPLLDINTADSAAFDALPGIGPFYAARMVEMRKRLGGYSYKEQLLDIWKFDNSKYEAIRDLIYCSKPVPYPLWTLSADSLRLHPYIGSWQCAKEIVLFRSNTPLSSWSIDELEKAGILSPENAAKLSKCLIAQ